MALADEGEAGVFPEQLADPGEWRTVVSGLTKGTPYTNPRQLNYNEITFKVAVIETALTK